MAETLVYVIHGAPIGGGGTTTDRAYIRLKSDLSEQLYYGTRGAGDNQLACPWGCAIDDTHLWICDFSNSRLMQRLRSDLTYVQKRASYARYSVHNTSAGRLFTGSTGVIDEVSKIDLSTIQSIAYPASGVEGLPQFPMDITSDESLLYAADQFAQRVVYYSLDTLAYAGEFGTIDSWDVFASGLAYQSGYLFVADSGSNLLYKVDASTWEKVATYGHTGGGYLVQPTQVAANATHVFVTPGDSSKCVVLTAGLSLETSLAVTSASAVAVDSAYVYVSDWSGYVRKFDVSTFGVVSTSGVIDADGIYAMAVDASYLYLLVQSDDLKVMRRSLSDFSAASEYADVGWAIFSNPSHLAVDDTYIYVSDNIGIHRINKSTLAYVDLIVPSKGADTRQLAINGATIYVCGTSAGGVQSYTFPAFAFVDESPATAGDPNFWFKTPSGITCDNEYIWVSDSTLKEIKVYDCATRSYVGKISGFAVGNEPQHLAVDETYLYVAANSTSYKYLKVAPFTLIDSETEEYAIGIDALPDEPFPPPTASSSSPSGSNSMSESTSGSTSGSASPSAAPPDVRLIRRLRQSPHLSDEQVWLFFSQFQLDVETGRGLTTGQGVDPQIMLQWSDDSGHTWSNEHWVSAGPLGSYQWRAIWRRLGKGRQRTWRVVVSDPIAWRILDAYVTVMKGSA